MNQPLYLLTMFEMNSNMLMDHNILVSNLIHCHLSLIILKKTNSSLVVIIL
jgi:hypothetical protein